MRWTPFYIICVLLAISVIAMCTNARAEERLTVDFTACLMEQDMISYTREAYWNMRNSDEVRKETNGSCVRDTRVITKGKQVSISFRGDVAHQVIEVIIHASNREGKYTPPMRAYAMRYFRVMLEGA